MSNAFEALGLGEQLVRTLAKLEFNEPTDIQREAIPHLLEGRDLMGLAETGSGKTGAFLLPVLELLYQHGERSMSREPDVLVLAPTRELVGQIGKTLAQFSRGLKIFHTTIYGGAPYPPQIQAMNRGVHILIATPGRLMDHMERGTVKLEKTHTMILDEADRMLDLGFKDDVMLIADKLPEGHQTVMFSATMNKGVSAFADGMLRKPVKVEVSNTNTVNDNIDHYVLACKATDKPAVLDHILEEGDVEKAIIFTRTKAQADKLTFDLKKRKLAVEALHGDHRQNLREKILRHFRSGRVKFLVATDVAARGIDVKDISHVINFDMPLEADAYVHRAGRTGRAGELGLCFSIVSKGEMRLLRQVERLIKENIPVFKDHPFHTALSESRPPNRRGGPGRGNQGRGGHGRGKPGGDFRKGDSEDWRDRKRRSKGKPKSKGATKGKRPATGSTYDPRDADRKSEKPAASSEKPRTDVRPGKPKGKKPAGKGWAKAGKPGFAGKGKPKGKGKPDNRKPRQARK